MPTKPKWFFEKKAYQCLTTDEVTRTDGTFWKTQLIKIKGVAIDSVAVRCVSGTTMFRTKFCCLKFSRWTKVSVCFWAFWIRIRILFGRIGLRFRILQTKNWRKVLISTVLWLLCVFLLLKNFINVPSKRNKHKNLGKFFFLASWRLLTKRAGSGSKAGSVSQRPRIRIRTKMSRIRNTAPNHDKKRRWQLHWGSHMRLHLLTHLLATFFSPILQNVVEYG